MAIINGYGNLNTYNPSVWPAYLADGSSNYYAVSDGYLTGLYEGYGFTYNGYYPVGGTLTSFSEYAGDSLWVEAFDFAISAKLAFEYIARNDMNGLFQIVLAGNDEIYGSTGDDSIAAYNGNDLIFTNGGNDLILAGGGHDTIHLNLPGNVILDGGAGFDWAVLSGSGGDYYYDVLNGAIEIYSDVTGTDVILQNVERVAFDNGVFALDIDGNAGQAYRLYQAAFDREPDVAGLGYWIDELDAGKGDLAWMALNFIISEEFKSTYGTPSSVSNEAFLDLIYDNVLDRAPDAAGFKYWMDELSDGFSRERVLASFSESLENKANVADAIGDGIWYV